MRARSPLLNKFSFSFIQPSSSATNMSAWALPLYKLTVKLIEYSHSRLSALMIKLWKHYYPSAPNTVTAAVFQDKEVLLLPENIALLS